MRTDKMVTNGGPQINLQKAPLLSIVQRLGCTSPFPDGAARSEQQPLTEPPPAPFISRRSSYPLQTAAESVNSAFTHGFPRAKDQGIKG